MTTYDKPMFLPAGDRAFAVELGDAIDPEVNRRVHSLSRAVENSDLSGVVDLVPTYRSLLVEYDPLQASVDDLQRRLLELERDLDASPLPGSKVVHLPTLYGYEYGPDLEHVATHAGLTLDEVVRSRPVKWCKSASSC